MRRARSLSESFSLSDNSSAYQESSGSDVGNEYDIVKVKVDKKDGKKPKFEFRRRGTIKDIRTFTDKWVDKYFTKCYEKKAQK